MLTGAVELRSITSRDQLAKLWLPWCVERDHPDHIVPIDREPARIPFAKQLRIGTIGEAPHRAALSNNDGDDTTESVAGRAQGFRAFPERGTIVIGPGPPLAPDDWPRAFALDDGGLMLHEACHRACALYLADVPFELRVIVHAIFDPWLMYMNTALRQGESLPLPPSDVS